MLIKINEMKKIFKKELPQQWSIAQTWNDSFRFLPIKEYKPRDYIYASEIGGSMIDRYYKMMGEQPTNPPNFRSLRKFEAGNFFEFILQFVLSRSGLLKVSQEPIKYSLPNCLPVSGRMDFIVGGEMDFEGAKEQIKIIGLPEYFNFVSLQVIDYLKERFEGFELEKYVLECKSAATITFDGLERKQQPILNHKLQTFHYVYGSELINFGKILYICKDDLRLIEFDIKKDDKDIFDIYKKDIETITHYYNSKELPPPCSEVLFDENTFNFRMNLQVEWSNYLTKIYSYENSEQFRLKWGKPVASFNRTFKRCVNGDKMTALNLDTIKEAKAIFKNWDDLVDLAKLNKQHILTDESE